MDENTLKTCTKCGVEKELTEFSNSLKNRKGVRANCKTCDRIRCKVWKYKNPDKIKATNNKRTLLRRENPEAEMLRRARRRAKVQCIPFSIDIDDINIPEICPILGICLKQSEDRYPSRCSPSLDKIDPDLGYIKGNVQVISYKANTMKSDATVPEMVQFALWVLESNTLDALTIDKLRIIITKEIQ